MAHIKATDAAVEIPVYAIGDNSLKTVLLRKAVGGRFGRRGANLIVTALTGINLEIGDGERIGLVGHNGAGKTTLLRVLAGVYPPTRGSVKIIGRVSPMFNISLGMSIDATGIENVRLCGALWGFSRDEIEAGVNDVVEFTELGDYLKIPVRTYSSGMLMRLSFAIATLRQPEILLLDEVIGVGDAEFVKKAEDRLLKLADRASIIVVASHSDAIIRRLCTKAIWLTQGAIGAFGEVEEVLHAYHSA
jgi:ABC-type polysaccharide/polyol phosphate transport system ATPase subunit